MSLANRKIKVLVVDDSAVSRDFITHLLQSDPAFEVVGGAHSGVEAIAALGRHKPDVVTMDIHMPCMDGYEATRQIMETQPLPIIIVSGSYDPVDVEKTFRAMEAGAVAAIGKPAGAGHPNHAAEVLKLINIVKAMAEVRVVRRWTKQRMAARATETAVLPRTGAGVRLVVIGASTGGPPVLHTVLAGLSKPFPLPIVIVQHISSGFVQGLVDWLKITTGMPVRLARHGELVQPGTAYVAPDGGQLRVETDGRLVFGLEPAEHGLRPSVSFLFRSIAKNYGSQAVGVLLTGMGRDGAEELKLMRDCGAVTIAQDEASSIVHGMPGEAIRLGAAVHVGNPERITALLQSLAATVPRQLSTATP